MKNRNLFTRRNFVKSGIATAGLGIVVKPSLFGNAIPVETLEAPGPIPLNNILTEYLQVEKKYGPAKVTDSIGINRDLGRYVGLDGCQLPRWKNGFASTLCVSRRLRGHSSICLGADRIV